MPLPLSADYDAASLRATARSSKVSNQTRRILTLAAIYDGATRTEVAMIGGVTVQIARDWVAKLNAHGPAGLIDRRGGGTPPILTDEHRRALAVAIEDGPIPAVPWRGALACDRPVPVVVGWLRGAGVQADAQPRAAGDGLPPALAPAAPSRPGPWCDRGF